eukprot:scaffold196802_cov28-Tisochrysis_lutea.AAC.1
MEEPSLCGVWRERVTGGEEREKALGSRSETAERSGDEGVRARTSEEGRESGNGQVREGETPEREREEGR